MSVICTSAGFALTIIASVVFVFLGKISIGGVLALSQLIGGILAPFQDVPIFITNLKFFT
jgi:hypothetical protein